MRLSVSKIPKRWTLYLIEAVGLGLFMVAAGVTDTLLEAPTSELHVFFSDPLFRRFLMGLAMGLTLICLIYSRWGARSGAHFNPAFTLTFALLGKIKWGDAVVYIIAQFVGGLCGVLLTHAILGASFAQPPVSFIVTVPGSTGDVIAFLMEVIISALLMGVALYTSNNIHLKRYTGLLCGLLVVSFVTFEAPFSGMSMNPARTLASAWPSGIWDGIWIYFCAPISGMGAAAFIYHLLIGKSSIACAKLNHSSTDQCPFNCNVAPHNIPTQNETNRSHFL
jgi:aquaporin Z